MNVLRRIVHAAACLPCLCPVSVWPATADLRITASSDGPVIAVRAMLPHDGGEVAALEVVWRQVAGADPVVEVTQGAPAHEDRWLMLDQVLEAGMGAYLDARLRYTRTGVSAALPAMAMAGELNAMIAAASHAFGSEGTALSPSTTAQLTRFSQLDWSATADLPSVRSGTQDKYLVIYRVLEAQRGELNRQLRADLVPLAEVPVWGGPPATDPRTSYRIASTCGTVFDADNFMCALELGLDESALPEVGPMIALTPNTAAMRTEASKEKSGGAVPRVRRRDAWLRAEIEVMNKRLDAIADMRQQAGLEERVRDLEDALASLRLEVNDASLPPEPWELPGSVDGRVPVRFDAGSVLPADQRGNLDLLAMQLAAMPGLRVVVSGVAGADVRGIRLAEQRTASVRAYLLKKGVPAVQVLSGVQHEGRPGSVLIEVLP